jgi:hypothetical protein
MKINLDKAYSWGGNTYGPGEANVPKDMVAALNLEQPNTPPKEQAKTPPSDPKAEAK